MSPEQEAAEALSVVEDENVGRPVRVRWTDSGQAFHGWRSRDALLEDSEPPAIETIGLWLGENDNVVMVAGSRDAANNNWGECQLVWKPAIKLVEWLS